MKRHIENSCGSSSVFERTLKFYLSELFPGKKKSIRHSRVERVRHSVEPIAKKTGTYECDPEYLLKGLIGVYGRNTVLVEALNVISRAADSLLPILIEGESGTGKELLAQSTHNKSDRSDAPFITVNCGALPESLVEAELFGHTKGAFTGATSERQGKFDAANKGTIFLDEIGELPLQTQVKLLRVLQSNEIQRVGADTTKRVDVRVIAATNRDLKKMVLEGAFREDLFFRLNVLHVEIPALRDRRDELPELFELYIQEAASELSKRPIKISSTLRRFLLSYDYPGNIRELKNIIYRLSCLADDRALMAHLPHQLRATISQISPTDDNIVNTDLSLAEVKKAAADAAEKQYLESKLSLAGGRVTELAKMIDMNRSHVQTLLKKHGINSKSFKTKSEN